MFFGTPYYSSHNGIRNDDWSFQVIEGHETNPVIGGKYRLTKVDKRDDNSTSTGLIHKDHDEEDQTDQAQNGRHDSSRNQELPGLVPLEGKEGKAKGDGTEGGQNRPSSDPDVGSREDGSHYGEDSEHL